MSDSEVAGAQSERRRVHEPLPIDVDAKLVERLRGSFVRAEADLSRDTLNKRIRNAVTAKIPNLLVVGEREQSEDTVTLRRYGSREQTTMPMAEFTDRLLTAIKTRSTDL